MNRTQFLLTGFAIAWALGVRVLGQASIDADKESDQVHSLSTNQPFVNLATSRNPGAGFAPLDMQDLRAKAEQGDAKAQFSLGLCYVNGYRMEKDMDQGLKWFRRAAEQGYLRAQCNLAECYLSGIGVAKNANEAVKWLLKATEQNFPPAEYNLGCCYAAGQGVGRDDAEALKWFRKAADHGFLPAALRLSECYGTGRGTAKNETEAVRWLSRAAAGNSAEAQFALAKCYLEGRGVPPEEVEASWWYRKAAEQNYPPAQLELGNCYANGQGVPQDYVEAVKWYRKAAERNFGPAQFNLANCYNNGRGVTQNDAEALKWFRKAADQNVSLATLWMVRGGQQGIPTGPENQAAGSLDKPRSDREAQTVRLGNQLSRDLLEKKWDQANLTLAALERLMPQQKRSALNSARFVVSLHMGNSKVASRWAAALGETYKDNALIQNDLAWSLITVPGNPAPNLELADKLASQASDTAQGKDPSILDTLARVKFMRGKANKAIELQEKAVNLAGKDLRPGLLKTLESYKQGKLPPP